MWGHDWIPDAIADHPTTWHPAWTLAMRSSISAPIEPLARRWRASGSPQRPPVQRLLPALLVVTVSMALTPVGTEAPLPARLARAQPKKGAHHSDHRGHKGSKHHQQHHHPPIPNAPAAASSHYLAKHGKHYLNKLGCHEGRHVRRRKSLEDAVVVLAFGRPVRRPGPTFGASLFGHGFVSTTGVIRSAQAYVRGYTRCVRPVEAARLKLALGTSNYGRQVS